MPKPLQIGELSRRSGLSHRTIHYYEKLGLIAPIQREGTGYRYYEEEVLKRLDKIAVLKRLGLSLEEISEVIDLYFEDASGIKGKKKVLSILEAQLAKTETQLEDLTTFRTDLKANIAKMHKLIAEAKKK